MRIAKYDVDGSKIILEVSDWLETQHSYVRLTEIIEVDLPELPPAITVSAQLAQLDAAEAELRNKFNENLSELMEKRANLRALTHEVAP